MSKIALSGNASGTGTLTLAAPNTDSDFTLILPDASGTVVVTGSTALTPSGTVIWFAANAAPTGYLKANGAAVSRTTYADLFAAIGTTFGVGDGSTTFNVPDLRGEFLRGWDDGRGIDSARVFGSAQSQSIESHSHVIRSDASVGNGDYNTASAGYSRVNYTNAAGGSETRPRNIALLACIKF
jgi:phage-related tail fiber protein